MRRIPKRSWGVAKTFGSGVFPENVIMDLSKNIQGGSGVLSIVTADISRLDGFPLYVKVSLLKLKLN